MKKEETVITLKNGGMHNQPKYKLMKEMVDNNKFKEARLYHLILTGATDPAVYRATWKTVVEKLRDNGMPCQWHSCIERDGDKDIDGKGLHMHIFMLIECKDQNPCRRFLNHRSNSKIEPIMERNGVKFYIAPPRSSIHRTKRKQRQLRYATLGSKEKIADCKVWISYLVKNRSKVAGMRNIYSASRDRSST